MGVTRELLFEEAERAREAADQFLALSENVKGRWRGTLSAVEEVRKMRKHQRVY